MQTNKIGIVGFGSYIPKYRIKIEEIAKAHKKDSNQIKSNLLIHEKSIASYDEDSATMSVEAAQNALKRSQIKSKKIDAIYIGSESHPYAVKPTSTIVGQALNLDNNFMTADLEFACKAGTAALQICYSLIKSNSANYTLAIGTDNAQAKPNNILQYSAAAGSAAFIIGKNKNEIVATIDQTTSITTNTPDFWRRDIQKYPTHAGRFTGQPSYFSHTLETTKKILNQTKSKPKDFDFVIFHQPNGKFPLSIAKKLGFSKEQILPGLLVTQIGNTYSASSLLSLSAILDIAKPNQKILLTSYGSGAGSDAFIFTTTNSLISKQKLAPNTKSYINKKQYLNYLEYKELKS
ncbi:hydroxymethylglutaryl-CoA synthase [Candidatus Dependentiae bacterium]|nr:hydroxymethylglutaryl-CoA synthase [Candidatus Dependentiae bacterium]